MSDRPRVSIVTITYNAALTFPVTARSIAGQDYREMEWIVIDGGSTDGTVELIRKVQTNISFWISEPDLGIYDAMNKGLKQAGGEWINFMNAGDSFTANNVLSRIFSENQDDAGILYGDSMVPYSDFNKLKMAGTPEQLFKGMVICHQSVFVRTKLISEAGFDTGYPIGADYKMLLQLLKSGSRFRYVGFAVAVFDNRGNTSINLYQTDLEHFRILKKEYRLTFSLWCYHQVLLGWYGFLTILYTIFPARLIFPFRDFVMKQLTPQNRQG